MTPATLVSIAVTPASPSIAKGATQQFTATGTYSDTSTANLTTSVTWNSATPAVASIGAGTGLAAALTAGTSQITATLGAVTSPSVILTVTQSGGVSVTGLSPAFGPVGASVTITGTNFGSTQGTSTVSFNGTVATATSWSATSILVHVPTGATTGYVVVTAGGVPSNGAWFTLVAIGFVQVNSAVPASASTVTVSYAQAQTAGNLNVVVVGWNNSTSQISSLTDSKGNAYVLAVGPTVESGAAIQAIYYAKNITAATANGNTVTVTFTASTPYPDIRIAEYSGIDPSVPVDVTAAGQGTSGTSSSGAVTTGSANDLLVGANLVGQHSTGPGAGYTSRIITSPDGDILEDQIVSATGSYSATAPLSGGTWIMQMVAFRANTFSVPPPTLVSIAVTPANPSIAGGTTQQFTATGTYSDSSTSNLTSNATWSSSVTAAATINGTGLATGVAAGTSQISATMGGVSSSPVTLTVTAVVPLSITGLNPIYGQVGTPATITGTSFGATQGTSKVTFNGTVATVTSWTATSIVVQVPTGATTGNVVVTVGGVPSNGVRFTVVAIKFVQVNSAVPTSAAAVTAPYTQAQTAGNLNVVVVGWNDASAQVTSVTDSKGNVYALAIGPTVQSGTATQAIYYATNIAGAAANGNTVTVTFNIAAHYPDLRIAEYSGIDPSVPVDVVAAADGTTDTSSSGAVTTGSANDLLVGANVVQFDTAGPGPGYTNRVITQPDSDILEDEIVSTAGSYSATAPLVKPGAWIMQMVAFRANTGFAPPPISVIVSPATASTPSGYGTQTFSVTVYNQLQYDGVTWSLSGAGCSGSTCGTLSNATSTSVTYNAPGNVPNPAAVILTAASVEDPTKKGTATITVTQGVLNVTVSPKRAAVTMAASQGQLFSARVTNDPQNAGVSWMVDGNLGGSATSGIVTLAGLYTPGTQPGLHTITATSKSNASVSASATIAVTDLTGVLTYHNDTARTGQNLKEYGLTPATVGPSTFGRLFSCPVDGYIYASPLYIAGLNVGGQARNVIFIATEHDSVYAFDADSPACVQLWKTSFLASGVTTEPPGDTGDFYAVFPEIGITSTPVIDASTNTIYVVPVTKETVGAGCSSASPCYVHRLHALDLTTGAEKLGGPVAITAPYFVPLFHLQRPALLLSNGIVYIAFGSHSDYNTYQGWLMGYDATTLSQKFAWSSTVASSGNNQGAIWQSGNGPALDASGNVYVETGNGAFDGLNNFGDSTVKLSASGSVLDYFDYFTPFDQATLDANDIDLGSSGVVILPDAVGSATHQHLALATGKTGILYLLDQTNLGKFNSGSNHDVQEVSVVPNTTNSDGGIFGQPAYWNGNLYVVGVNDSLRQFLISNGSISIPSSSNSTNAFPFRGATPAVSANGATNGIVWLVDVTAYQTNGWAILDAYDATNVSTPLYSSPASGGVGAGPLSSKFTVPTVANGKVYVVGQYSFAVFGLLPN